MKKSIFVIGLIGILILSGCGGQSKVKKYNDSIYTLVRECTDSTQVLFENYENNDGSTTVESIMQTLSDDIAVCQKSETKLKDLGDYDGDSSLIDAATKLIGFEISYLEKFGSTNHYWNIENITEEDKLQYNGMVNELNELEDELNAQFLVLQQAQEVFAAKYSLILDDSESAE